MTEPTESVPDSPLDYLAWLLELGLLSSHRKEWTEFGVEAALDGWFDGLDANDGIAALWMAIEDLGSNPDGSHFLRWRADQIRDGIFTADDDPLELHDPTMVAAALERIAASMCKAAPAGLDR